MLDDLREQYKQSELLAVFEVRRSRYRYRCEHANQMNPERERLKAAAIAIHAASRGAAGARTISGMLKQQGESVGRYKAGSLRRRQILSASNPEDIDTKWQRNPPK